MDKCKSSNIDLKVNNPGVILHQLNGMRPRIVEEARERGPAIVPNVIQGLILLQIRQEWLEFFRIVAQKLQGYILRVIGSAKMLRMATSC